MADQEVVLEKQVEEDLDWLDRFSDFLDSKYRIPLTNIRFGADFVIGLIPTAGDIISFGISGTMLFAMARKGVSAGVLLRMLGNLLLDVTVGAIPIVGDIFDLTYRANRRNFELLKRHYDAGKSGNTFVAILVVLLLLTIIFVGIIWLLWTGLSSLMTGVSSLFTF